MKPIIVTVYVGFTIYSPRVLLLVTIASEKRGHVTLCHPFMSESNEGWLHTHAEELLALLCPQLHL